MKMMKIPLSDVSGGTRVCGNTGELLLSCERKSADSLFPTV